MSTHDEVRLYVCIQGKTSRRDILAGAVGGGEEKPLNGSVALVAEEPSDFGGGAEKRTWRTAHGGAV